MPVLTNVSENKGSAEKVKWTRGSTHILQSEAINSISEADDETTQRQVLSRLKFMWEVAAYST